jgi:outer membrane protein assembly factor BamB
VLKNNDHGLSDESIRQTQLRLWPGVVLVLLQWLVRFVIPAIVPGSIGIAVLGAPLFWLTIVVWWAFFSRAQRLERWGAVILMIVALAVTQQLLLHDSIMKAGMGLLYFIYATPPLCLAFVIWAVASRRLPDRPRRGLMVATILLACGAWVLVRTGGFDANFHQDFAWRWTDSPEDRLLEQADEEPMVPPSAAAIAAISETEPEWPGFRGPERDGIIHGVRINTDWAASPPVELWRRPVGPGWSSFAVHGTLFFTQEQRGDDEIVSCYDMTTGQPAWRHRDAARFWESNAGPGPRGTPTLSKGRVYSLGGTGIMNVLNAGDGTVVWSRNAADDTDTAVPIWGFSSSPLVLDDVVIVAVAGSMIAYDLATGEPRWSNSVGGDCYSSPHLIHIDGVAQVLLQNEAGTSSFSPVDGTVLWEHAWPGNPIVQPTLTVDGDILISVDEQNGIRRISVAHGPEGWTVEELWTSDWLKPYFNDSTIHNGYVYGFDGPLLACIDIDDGAQQWRGGRYGRGQFILLADQGLLLVLAEKGGLALVEASPGQFTEIAKIPAIKGKTWNHPVLVGDILLVRNGEEMVAFRLSLEG